MMNAEKGDEGEAGDGAGAVELPDQAIRIMAKSIVRELHSRGYGARHVVALSTELLGLANDELVESRRGADLRPGTSTI